MPRLFVEMYQLGRHPRLLVGSAALCRLHGPEASGYLTRMLARRVRTDGFIDPCIPTLAAKPGTGPGWVHEIKQDARRDGAVVRLFTRRGHDWTERYPAIASAAAKLRARSFTLDGEAVVTGADGVAVFDALHRRHKATDAMLYAFRFGGTRRQGSPATAPLAR